jgi:hypothetical protein
MMNSNVSLPDERQRQLVVKRTEEAAKARQDIFKQFPRTDMFRRSEPPQTRMSEAKQSVKPKTKEQLLERTGSSNNSNKITSFNDHGVLTGTVSLPTGVYTGDYVLHTVSSKSARPAPIPHGKGTKLRPLHQHMASHGSIFFRK